MYLLFTNDSLQTIAENLMDGISGRYNIDSKSRMLYMQGENGVIINQGKIVSITPKELRLESTYSKLKITYVFGR
jgi:hypothetical protein